MASTENEIIGIIFIFLFQLTPRVFSAENKFGWNH